MPNERLTFKEMCARFDVTPRTLRHYEYIELLFPEREGRSRFYGPREIARMKLILRGRRFGYSLERIRQWLLLYDERGTREQMEFWIVSAANQIEELKQRRDQIEEVIDELTALRQEVVESLESGDLPD